SISWKFHRSVASIQRLSLAAKTPDLAGFATEAELYSKYSNRFTRNLQSLFLHSNFANPNREHISLKPKRKIIFPGGVPIRFFLWVYSNGYDLNLRAHLWQKKSGKLLVSLGKLDHFGWKRFEITIPLQKKHRLLYEKRRFPIELTGLSLKPGSSLQKGDFFLYFDQMAVLLENGMEYPGSEIRDTWKGN
ncbi:MAG: flagellar filament outer layer protein FlaA, partial [Spirochaetota bacterium]